MHAEKNKRKKKKDMHLTKERNNLVSQILKKMEEKERVHE